VKKCRERSSGRQWAAKFLRKRRRAQGGLRAEALHEVAVLDAAAHCSRLVSLHQVFETNTEMVLVLEL
jgi:serine/threonine kinase 17